MHYVKSALVILAGFGVLVGIGLWNKSALDGIITVLGWVTIYFMAFSLFTYLANKFKFNAEFRKMLKNDGERVRRILREAGIE